MTHIAKAKLLFGLAASMVAFASCTEKEKILIDGSSTVYPVTEAVAEEYRGVNGNVNVTVGVSGTGGGFKKFCNGETDISDASRPIKQKEKDKCAAAGIKYLEIPVAYDGLAVLVNTENDWVDQLTVDQLKTIFRAESPAKTWKEVNAAWPEDEIKIYAPGQDSGTFDYFVEAILGKKAKMRGDASFSEDDNVLVTGIAGDKASIGFFGLAYYEENKDKLKLVPIVNPKTGAAVQPNLESVKTGAYAPLSRPIFIYVSDKAKGRQVVVDYVNFYLDQAGELSKQVGYIPLPGEMYTESKNSFAAF